MRKILKYPLKRKTDCEISGDLDTLFKISDSFLKKKNKKYKCNCFVRKIKTRKN